METKLISPKLVGDKVILGPMREDLADTYRQWVHDMQNGIGITTNILLTHKQELDWLQNMAKPNEGFFTIYAKKSGEPVGTISLLGLDYTNRYAELGIFIGPDECKNMGYGKESLLLVMDYAFNVMNLESLYLRVHAFNERAAALYEKVGFKPAGKRRHACYLNGEYHDDILMDIIRKEFKGYKIQKEFELFKKRNALK